VSQPPHIERFEVAVTGAFLTGVPLKVKISEYADLQHRLGEDLRAGGGEDWDYEIGWQGTDTYGSGGGYTSSVPLVLVRRHGEALRSRLEEHYERRPDSETEWFRERLNGWSWKLCTVQVDIYDLGVGVISGRYEVEPPPPLSLEESCRAVEAVGHLRRDPVSGLRSPLAEAYQVLANETVGSFAAAVDRCAGSNRRPAWSSPLLGADSSYGLAGRDGEGRLLWLHPVFIVEAEAGSETKELRSLAQPFRPTFSKPIVYWDGLFVPGIATSVVVVRDRESGRHGPPLRLTGLMWAYYALFMEMDRALLAMVDDGPWEASDSLARLEDESKTIFGMYIRIQEAKTRLDSALTDLAGGQLSIWGTMADVQKFDDLVRAVEEKLEVLQRVAERRVEEAAASRARRTGRILSGLTALTVVTVAVALIGNFIGTPADALGHVEVRVAIVGAAFFLALLLFLESQREAERS